MTFTQIRYFIEVANQNSFTKAATCLYVAQQVVSRQIKSLEEEVGFPLFYRTTKKIELTPGGELLYLEWAELIRKSDTAVSEARQIMENAEKVIRIGFVPIGTIVDKISRSIRLFCQEHPHLELVTSSHYFNSLFTRLERRELDCIISFKSELLSLPDDFICIPFMPINPAIILSKEHPVNHRDLVLTDLKDETFYIMSDTFSDEAESFIISQCKVYGFEPKRIRYFDDVESLEASLHTAKGVTVCYREFFRDTDHSLSFYPIKQQEVLAPVEFYIVFHKSRQVWLNRFAEILSES